MEACFTIYIDRLRQGREEQIEESLSPEFMDIEEEGVHFKHPVSVKGKASLEGETLILALSIQTVATMKCSICNEEVSVELKIPYFYHTEESAQFKSGIFDFKEVLRETILLELPQIVECKPGQCPERKNLEKYFSKH